MRGVEAGPTARSEWASLTGTTRPRTRPVAEADYLSTRVTEIYVGRSRHWVVVWLWFLS